MPFENRWRIEGVLTTASPLHIGDGTITQRDDLVEKDADGNEKRKIDISAVATDYSGHPYIPGKTIKGNLRSWIYANVTRGNVSLDIFNAVFGSEDADDENAVGGKAEFQDAFAVGPFPQESPVPYWKPERLTGVHTSVAIDRRTRTAMPKKLFYKEFVPPEITFAVTITGQDLKHEELYLLLAALDGFNSHADPVALGSDTGDGQGHFTWELRDISRITKKDVSTWLEKEDKGVGYAALIPLSKTELNEITTAAVQAYPLASAPSVTLSFAIHFDGPFLVNDPSQTKKEKGSIESESLPDHAPLLDYKGRVALPPSSLRGAVRSQAERIVRTLSPGAACHSVETQRACKPIYDARDVDKLCLTCQVFGAAGWRTPVEFHDIWLVEDSNAVPFHQEFLAIDRFTGGGAKSLKFNAAAFYRPIITGKMNVDLERVGPWSLGLLALTLRDMIEGDVPLGFGAAKGYGDCKLRITGLQVHSTNDSPEFGKILQENGVTEENINNLDITSIPGTEVQMVLMNLVDAFQNKVSGFKNDSSARGGDNGKVS